MRELKMDELLAVSGAETLGCPVPPPPPVCYIDSKFYWAFGEVMEDLDEARKFHTGSSGNAGFSSPKG